jgi:hypothetical protein
MDTPICQSAERTPEPPSAFGSMVLANVLVLNV